MFACRVVGYYSPLYCRVCYCMAVYCLVWHCLVSHGMACPKTCQFECTRQRSIFLPPVSHRLPEITTIAIVTLWAGGFECPTLKKKKKQLTTQPCGTEKCHSRTFEMVSFIDFLHNILARTYWPCEGPCSKRWMRNNARWQGRGDSGWQHTYKHTHAHQKRESFLRILVETFHDLSAK